MTEDNNLLDKLNKPYLHAIHSNCHKMLVDWTSDIFGKRRNLNYTSIKVDLRLEYENIVHFIKECNNHQLNQAVDMLVMLEHLLNEIGPYLKLESLFDTLLNRVSDNLQKSRLLMCQARVLKSSKNKKLSTNPIKEAISILTDFSEINETLGEAYKIGAWLSNHQSDYDLGNQIFDKVFAWSEQDQFKLGQLNLAFILSEKAKSLEREGKIKEAIEKFKEVINLMEGYDIQQAKVQNSLGMLNWRFGYASDAIECFYDAIKKYKGIGEDRWILGFQTNLGLVYCEMGNLDTSNEITSTAYETLKFQGPRGWMHINLLNSGRILSRRFPKKQKYFQEAEKILLESFEGFKTLEYWESYILNGVELAELHYKYDKFDTARKYISITITKAKEKKFTKWMRYFRALCLSGLLHHKNGETKLSLEQLKEAESLSEEIKNNKWKEYDITKTRYNQLKEIHD